MNYYSSPLTFQRGHGLGNILSKIFRSVVPILQRPIVKKGLKRAGSALLSSGVDYLNRDIPLKQSLRDTAVSEGRQLAKRFVRATQPSPSSSRVRAPPRGRKRSVTAAAAAAKRKTKKRKLDIFDFK